MTARTFPAITLHQPWASLLAAGIKQHETRGFRLPDRLLGQWVAIHAAKRQPALLQGLDPICRRTLGQDYFRRVPRGAVLALVRFTSCKGTMLTSPAGYEDEFSGDWGPGRYAWRVGDRLLLAPPFQISGRQLWWRVDLDVPDLGGWPMNRYEQKGESDARRGITACDLDDPAQRRHWARGHDRTVRAGEGPLPRFGLICRRSAAANQALASDRQLGEDRAPTHGSLI